jgi:ribonucleoside-diphosphate reductase alpha chain
MSKQIMDSVKKTVKVNASEKRSISLASNKVFDYKSNKSDKDSNDELIEKIEFNTSESNSNSLNEYYISSNTQTKQLVQMQDVINGKQFTQSVSNRKANSKSRKNKNPKNVADIKFYKPLQTTKVRNQQKYMDMYEKIISKHDKMISPTPFFVLGFLHIVRKKIITRESINLPELINLNDIAKRISQDLPDVIQLDEFYGYLSDSLITLSSHHHYYGKLASYICVMRLHAITPEFLSDTANLLQINLDKNNQPSPVLSDETFDLIKKHKFKLQKIIDTDMDYSFDYFGLKTLERSYLYKLNYTKYKIIERPQHLLMRVALGIHGSDIDAAIETYNLMSNRMFTHATPTLFNSGTIRPQMSSCFLQSVDDSIESIMNAVRDVGFTSKWSGGIGIHLSALRARGSLIRGTNGLSSGIIPFCVMLNKEAKYINQGGKRNGSIAAYLEPWHSDIYDFCDLRKDTGNDDNRAHDLFLALWIPDLFMERVENDEQWCLMCPDECPGLNLVHSDQFKRLYEQYESEGRYKKKVRARDVWKHIIASQGETGFPYTLFKDHANSKSNQQNLGTIRSSNLCAEIIQYSDEDETAVCNLASVCLPRFIEKAEDGKMSYNHKKLMSVVKVMVRNLDKIIDRNYYPTEKTKISNMRHRPMGIGVQGLADLFNMMGCSFDSAEAKKLNKQIFESIYFAAITESNELAKKLGPYSSFKGSEFSKGRLQYHLWDLTEDDLEMGYDWKNLIEDVKKYGTRNSLLTAVMPTASSSQIMGNSECCEPRMSNVFTRTTLAGMFVIVNPFLMKDLMEEGLWDDDMRKKLIIYNGSVQQIEEIPDKLKLVYKTAYEIDQMHLVEQSADRGAFIDQSQSFNLFFAKPSFDLQTAALFGGWKAGLKTGEYYLRTQPAVNPIQFGIDIDDIKRLTGRENIRDFISDSYDINTDTDSKKLQIVKPKPEACLWKPGMKPADCIACGS